ncbi:MAG TPA: rhodanese-like domain-containing protein [Bacillota bacterium]|nr:rhodanese-like domain-containing protein [Bacillota bacterium]
MKTISPIDLLKKLEEGKVTILDVRSEEKFALGKLRHNNAKLVNIFKEDIFNLAVHENIQLPKNEEVIVTCTTGNSATKCTRILMEHGYDVTLLEGGMVQWNQDTKHL